MAHPKAALALLLVLAATAPASARAQGAPDDPARLERIRRARELFAAEPTWSETVEAATRYLRVHPEAIEQVRDRLRSKAGAPVLLFSGYYQHAEGSRELRISPGPARDLQDRVSSDHPRTAVLMGFNLPDSIFTPAELQSYTLTEIQMGLIRSMNMWYFYRHHFGLRLMVDPPVDPRARSALEIRIRGFTALLDVATGGWFSRQLPEGSL